MPGSGHGPQVLAVKPGRGEQAARDCLQCLTAEQRQQVRSYHADMGATFHKACQELLEIAQWVVDRFHVAQLWNDSLDRLRKKNHKSLQGDAVEGGAQGVPFTDVGDAPRPGEPARRGANEPGGAVHADPGVANAAPEAFLELDGIVRTYERWQERIPNYFERGQTSGVVEGINNKARVIAKRAYGIKSAQTLWTRLVLDLNRAAETVTHTIAALRALVQAFRALFSLACA